jgi:hypothetical protein
LNKQQLFTELSIKIATLDMKLNKVLELLNKPEVTIDNIKIIGAQPGHGASFIGAMDYLNCDKITPQCIEGKFCECADKLKQSVQPPQWPNESHTDYLKRIGQYNEAQSEDENFTGEFK